MGKREGAGRDRAAKAGGPVLAARANKGRHAQLNDAKKRRQSVGTGAPCQQHINDDIVG